MPGRCTACALLLALAASGCGKSAGPVSGLPPTASKSGEPATATALGFPVFATKNTTRVGGADPAADAAGVAQAVYPSVTAADRPHAVALVDGRDWRTALAASVLMAPPIRAPVLLGDGTDLPAATASALQALAPSGSDPAGGAQVVRIGNVARPSGLKTTDLVGADPFALARAIDAFQAAARGSTAASVVVASADDPGFAMPAAAWAAKSGDPILFTHRDSLPEPTRVALAAHRQPHIYVLGPSTVISASVTKALRRLGTVIRIEARTPQSNAVAFARYIDSSFGWGVVDPGHGLVFASPRRPTDAAAAAALSASGTYGPLLLVGDHGDLPHSVANYLLDIQPGYSRDPTRGVYNHGWIVGDDGAVSIAAQAQIDSDLEIAPTGNSVASQP
ncbi:MAG: hypothetical protein QOF12_87 [Solirubrobacteraceae bacterium]|jgi:hypothetical protein|nr:hypothetical protein [Solirubrobacteraceae bacterium]